MLLQPTISLRPPGLPAGIFRAAMLAGLIGLLACLNPLACLLHCAPAGGAAQGTSAHAFDPPALICLLHQAAPESAVPVDQAPATSPPGMPPLAVYPGILSAAIVLPALLAALLLRHDPRRRLYPLAPTPLVPPPKPALQA